METLITINLKNCSMELFYNDKIFFGADKFIVTGRNQVKIARIDVVNGLVWENFPLHILKHAMESPYTLWSVQHAG